MTRNEHTHRSGAPRKARAPGKLIAGPLALLALGLASMPVAAAPAPPTVAFPTAAITTGGRTITVTGTGPAGASVVIFSDTDGNGRSHSLEPQWYQTIRRDGSFSITVFLVDNTISQNLLAYTVTGSEESAPVKLPVITQRPGAPIAAPPVAPVPVAPVQPVMPAVAPVAVPAPAPVQDLVIDDPVMDIVTGGDSYTITGRAPAGMAVVVFADLDQDGWYHSIEPGWYVRAARDGTFALKIPLFENTTNLDLMAHLDDGTQRSLPVKLPVIFQVPGAPVAAPQAPVPPVAAPVAAPVAPAVPAAPATAQGSVTMEYGAYSCGQPQRSRSQPFTPDIPKGSLTMNPNGTYVRFDNGTENESGAYTYDEASGLITWLSGPFAAMQPVSTSFKRNQTTAQIDVNFHEFWWICGINLNR